MLGDLLRAYAIRLYWTPNYLLAGEQATADALYSAVPDLGGYLLKIGSEKQGVSCQDIAAVWVAFFSRWQRYRCRQGHPDVATINPIARSLMRPAGSGQVRARPLRPVARRDADVVFCAA